MEDTLGMPLPAGFKRDIKLMDVPAGMQERWGAVQEPEVSYEPTSWVTKDCMTCAQPVEVGRIPNAETLDRMHFDAEDGYGVPKKHARWAVRNLDGTAHTHPKVKQRYVPNDYGISLQGDMAREAMGRCMDFEESGWDY